MGAFDALLAPTALDAGEDAARDSDLDPSTTRLLPDDSRAGLIVLADDGGAGFAEVAGPGGTYSQAAAHDSVHNDAGFVEPAPAAVEGRVWEDADEDGMQDADERLLSGLGLTLERRALSFGECAEGFAERSADGAYASDLDASGEPLVPAEPSRPYASGDGSDAACMQAWEEAARAESGLDGGYRFEGLAAFDEDGMPYVYRVRIEMPEGALGVAVDAPGVPDDLDNDFAPDACSDGATAATAELAVAVPLEGGANAYGQAYDYARATSYERGLGNPVDAGVAFAEDPAAPGANAGPWPFFPTTGDPLRPLKAAAAIGVVLALALLAAAALRRRRRAPREGDGRSGRA